MKDKTYKPPIKKGSKNADDQHLKVPRKNLKVEDGSLKINRSSEDNSRIKELEKLLNKRESEIKTFKERLKNDKEILQDVIGEKKLLNKKIQDFELKEMDAKLNEFQKLQQDHYKTEHRLQVIKKLLDDANAKIGKLEKTIEDLRSMGRINYLLGRFPESYKEYEKNK